MAMENIEEEKMLICRWAFLKPMVADGREGTKEGGNGRFRGKKRATWV